MLNEGRSWTGVSQVGHPEGIKKISLYFCYWNSWVGHCGVGHCCVVVDQQTVTLFSGTTQDEV